MKCPSCKQEVRIGSNYCHHCGELLENIFRQEIETSTQTQGLPVGSENVLASQNIIADYLLILPKSGQWEDQDLLEKLEAKGHERVLSWYVIGMIPLIAGRELLKDKHITFQYSVDLCDDDGKPTQSIEFKNFPVYLAIIKSWHEIITHPNIKNIMIHSAEVQAVYGLIKLNDNLKPGDSVLTEPLLSKPI
jgi:hypothetical protein